MNVAAPDPVLRLVRTLSSEGFDLVRIDEPADPSGPWWIDLKVDGLRQTVVWQRDRGFGLFLTEQVFGEHPQEVMRSVDAAASRLLQHVAQRSRAEGDRPVTLRTLRRLRGRNQLDVAQVLDKRQSAVSKLERNSDPKLSSLSEFVGAVGGRLVVSVEFPDRAGEAITLALGPTGTGPLCHAIIPPAHPDEDEENLPEASTG